MSRNDGRNSVVVILAAAFLLSAAGGAFATGADYGPLPTPVLALNGTEE